MNATDHLNPNDHRGTTAKANVDGASVPDTSEAVAAKGYSRVQVNRQLWFGSVFILLVGVVLQLFIFQNHRFFFTGSDFEDYAFQSGAILRGSLPNSILKPPGAGLWIAGYRFLFGDNMTGFALFSSIGLGILPFLAYWFGVLVRSIWTGIFCAAFVAWSPAFVMHSVLAETPAIIALAVCLTLLMCYRRTGSLWLLVLCAGALFFAYLCRPDFLLYGLLGFVLPISRVQGRWKGFRGVAVFATIFSLFLAVLSVVSAGWYGRVIPPRYDAYIRYFSVFQTGQNYKIDERAPEFQDIKQSLLAIKAISPDDAEHFDFLSWRRSWFVIRVALKIAHGSWYEADQRMDQASFGAIRSHLGKFFRSAGLTFASFVLFSRRLTASAQPTSQESAHTWLAWGEQLDIYGMSSPEYQKAVELSRQLSTVSTKLNGRVMRFHGLFQNALATMPLLIYPGLALLFWKSKPEQKAIASALLVCVLACFGASAIGSFFAVRYLASHSYVLWILAGWGYSTLLSADFLVDRARKYRILGPWNKTDFSRPLTHGTS